MLIVRVRFRYLSRTKTKFVTVVFDREGGDGVVKILPFGAKGPELFKGVRRYYIERNLTLNDVGHFQGRDPERSVPL
jgi:hypothetical protein